SGIGKGAGQGVQIALAAAVRAGMSVASVGMLAFLRTADGFVGEKIPGVYTRQRIGKVAEAQNGVCVRVAANLEKLPVTEAIENTTPSRMATAMVQNGQGQECLGGI